MSLRALVIGAGYAGQGHAMALRDAGVEIVGIASRTEAIVRRVAAEFEIPHASTDWRRSLEELRPEIVAVATPGGTHLEMISAAVEAGCHIYADKPLATTAADSRALYLLAEARGVKTAYAASYRYQPPALLARRLIQRGDIGRVEEVECTSHFDWPRLTSFGWPHRLDQGGGRLNNNFTHKLAIVLHVLDGCVLEAMGETRNDLRRVPVGPALHDFRDFTRSALTPDAAAELEWTAVDSDWAYTALCRIRSTVAAEPAVSAVFRHSSLHPSRHGDAMVFYGDEGALHLEGAYALGTTYFCRKGGSWEEIPVPQDILASLPPIEDNTQRNWTQLARDFVADIHGQAPPEGYLTFRDGWIFQAIIDLIRSGTGWTPVPCAPGD